MNEHIIGVLERIADALEKLVVMFAPPVNAGAAEPPLGTMTSAAPPVTMTAAAAPPYHQVIGGHFE